MVNQSSHRRTAAISAVALAGVAVLGGTGYAASRPSQHPAVSSHHAKSLSKKDVKKLVKSYVKKHAAELTGPPGVQGIQGPAGPGALRFALGTTSTSSATHTLRTLGAWTVNLTCGVDGVAVQVKGPGLAFGTNTLGSTNGGPGASYETAGSPGGFFGIGTGAQGSQTIIVTYKQQSYAIHYFANAVAGTPVQCKAIGYAIKL